MANACRGFGCWSRIGLGRYSYGEGRNPSNQVSRKPTPASTQHAPANTLSVRFKLPLAKGPGTSGPSFKPSVLKPGAGISGLPVGAWEAQFSMTDPMYCSYWPQYAQSPSCLPVTLLRPCCVRRGHCACCVCHGLSVLCRQTVERIKYTAAVLAHMRR